MEAVWRWCRRLLAVILGLVLVVVAGASVLLFTPVLDPSLRPQASPLRAYAPAVSRIAAIQAEEAGLPLIEHGGSIALLTGARTPVAIVLLHGYTNTPDEFRILAQAYREQGHNVWVPRLPFHSPADKFSRDFSRLTAEGLREFLDATVDLAAGLGDTVHVVGLSGGGSLALWAGLERLEVSRTVLISPLLAPAGYEEWMLQPMARAMRLSPTDLYSWWNPQKGADNVAGMVYPQYSVKGISALLGLKFWVDGRLAREPQGFRGEIVLIRNDGDPSINGALNQSFVTRIAPTERVRVVTIPASAGLDHDFIAPDPEFATDEQVKTAYQLLAEALELPLPDPLSARQR